MQLVAEDKKCTGCRVCLMACSLENSGEERPWDALIKVVAHFPQPGTYEVLTCDQCGECARCCPEGAIYQDGGAYRVDKVRCTRCMVCVDACVNGVMRVSDGGYPVKCNACGVCQEFCPARALALA